MTKRLNQINTFKIKKENQEHIITLERLKNDIYGTPRYKAVIIFLASGDYNFFNAVFTFKGHYLSERDEAEYILNHYYSTK